MTQSPPRCLLAADELSERARWIRERFAPHVVEVERLDAGHRYWFRRTSDRLRELADFVAFEARCCPHRDYVITARSGDPRVALEVTGPEGTRSPLPGVPDPEACCPDGGAPGSACSAPSSSA